MMLEECNWVQALEGDIDSSHIDFVHAKRRPESKQRGTFHRDKRPRLEVLPTDYGACYSARRRARRRGTLLAPHHPVHPALLLDDRGQRSPHRLRARLGAARRPLQSPVRDARRASTDR